jgi:glutaminyl-peptide cyclotransferase
VIALRSESRLSCILTLMLLSLFAAACDEKAASDGNQNSPSSKADKISDFDAARAFDHIKKMCDLGPRPSGSEGIKRAQDYIQSEFKSYGLNVIEHAFTANTPRGKIPMKNIIAELPGEKPELVLIAGHYDTKLQPGFVGANDGGSSTAAVLESSRVLAKTRPEYTLWFVMFDGEEAVVDWEAMGGMDNTYGSRELVAKMKADGSLGRVRALILYDMVGDKKLDLLRDENSTPWLVEAIWNTAKQTVHSRFFLANRTSMSDDHLPFIGAGIPAVDLIDFDYGPGHSYWHTNSDTLDKVSGESVKAVGDVVIRSLPEVFRQLNARKAGAAGR